ncbi:hypothetical protein ACXIZN_25295 [Amycolatopsis sp. TRM77291]
MTTSDNTHHLLPIDLRHMHAKSLSALVATTPAIHVVYPSIRPTLGANATKSCGDMPSPPGGMSHSGGVLDGLRDNGSTEVFGHVVLLVIWLDHWTWHQKIGVRPPVVDAGPPVASSDALIQRESQRRMDRGTPRFVERTPATKRLALRFLSDYHTAAGGQ